MRSGSSASSLAQPVEEQLAARRAAQLEDGLVGEGREAHLLQYCPPLASRLAAVRVRGLDWWTGVWLAVTAWAMARTLRSPSCRDTFLDLNAGRVIAEDGIPRHDTLTVVAQGRDWVDQQWLAHLAFRGAEAAGGLAAVALVASLAWLAAATVIVVDLRAQGLPGPRAAIVGFAAVLGTVSVATRPRAGVLAAALRRAAGGAAAGRGGAPARVVVAAGARRVGEPPRRGRGRRRARARLGGAAPPLRRVAVAAPLTLLATPYGLGIVDYLRDVDGQRRDRGAGERVAALRTSGTRCSRRSSRCSPCPPSCSRCSGGGSRCCGWLTVPPLALASLQSQRVRGAVRARRRASARLAAGRRRRWRCARSRVRCGSSRWAIARARRRPPSSTPSPSATTSSGATDMPDAVARGLRAAAGGRARRRRRPGEQLRPVEGPRRCWGRVAVDSRLELLSEDEIRAYAAFLAGASWRRYAAGYDAVVVDPRSHAELAGAIRAAAGWRVLEDGPEALVAAGVRLGRGEQLLDRLAAGLVGQERLVARVLQQAADEVGHAGDEVADRAVGAHAVAARGERVLEVVAEAAQHLELEVAPRRRRAPR